MRCTVDKKAWWRVCLVVSVVVPAASAWGCTGDDGGTPDATDSFDAREALDLDATGYPQPPPPYGTAVDQRIDNLQFVDSDGNPLSLAGFYNDHGVKLLWVYATAGWCTACAAESTALPGFWTTYHPQGLEILGVVFQDNAGAPATTSYARNYATRYGWPFWTASDEPFVLRPYFVDVSSTPLNMLVDLTGMTIKVIEMGYTESTMRAHVERYLAEIADRS